MNLLMQEHLKGNSRRNLDSFRLIYKNRIIFIPKPETKLLPNPELEYDNNVRVTKRLNPQLYYVAQRLIDQFKFTPDTSSFKSWDQYMQRRCEDDHEFQRKNLDIFYSTINSRRLAMLGGEEGADSDYDIVRQNLIKEWIMCNIDLLKRFYPEVYESMDDAQRDEPDQVKRKKQLEKQLYEQPTDLADLHRINLEIDDENQYTVHSGWIKSFLTENARFLEEIQPFERLDAFSKELVNEPKSLIYSQMENISISWFNEMLNSRIYRGSPMKVMGDEKKKDNRRLAPIPYYRIPHLPYVVKTDPKLFQQGGTNDD
ncbi:hypothetical protein SNEBB_005955 [Seison nebaliae]|nr:hypothetical protein SNEBB_005955 [Seison nebaliae]